MLCGVKFCGGCNPRYDRGEAVTWIRLHYEGKKDRTGELLRFDFAKEEAVYDALLVIGGCSACCASYGQYTVNGPIIKLWDMQEVSKLDCLLS